MSLRESLFMVYHSFPSCLVPLQGDKESGYKSKKLIDRALSYCAAWISGNGCVPINHLMVCPHFSVPSDLSSLLLLHLRQREKRLSNT